MPWQKNKPRTHVTLNRPLIRENLAWAAGFFDGEGSFTCTVRPHGRMIEATCVQAYDSQVLETFWESVGGVGRIVRSRAATNTRGPLYRWQVHNFESVQFTAAILWFHLSDYKKEQYAAACAKYQGYR